MQSPLKLGRVFLPTSAGFGSGPLECKGIPICSDLNMRHLRCLQTTDMQASSKLYLIRMYLIDTTADRQAQTKERKEEQKRQLCHPRDPTHTVLFQEAHTPNHLKQQQQYSKEKASSLAVNHTSVRGKGKYIYVTVLFFYH